MIKISVRACIICVVAILAIAVLEVVALLNGQNGVMFAAACSGIIAVPAFLFGKVIGRNGSDKEKK